jgi:hypothetical protein
MGVAATILKTPNRRIAAIAMVWFALDQFTKYLVSAVSRNNTEHIIVDGFFSSFIGATPVRRESLSRKQRVARHHRARRAAGVVPERHHFGSDTALGQIAFGLIFGGIMEIFSTGCCPRLQVVISSVLPKTARQRRNRFPGLQRGRQRHYRCGTRVLGDVEK